MWTAEHVRDRFTEAAEVERRSPLGVWGPSTKLGFWPEYKREFSDKAGWSDETWREIREARNRRRIPPSPSETSRAEEVLLDWTPRIREDRRKLVWFWAHSSAGGLYFDKVCKHMGWAKSTAYQRVESVMSRLAGDFVNEGKVLKLDGVSEYRRSAHGEVVSCYQMGVVQPAKSPTAFISEKPHDLLKTPAEVAAFVDFLEDVNAQRKRALTRRFKARECEAPR